MYCSNCNIEWSERNSFCQNCGRPLQPRQTVESPKTSKLLICPRCNTKASRDDVYCKQCGYLFGDIDATGKQVILTQPRRTSRSEIASPDIEVGIQKPEKTGNPILGRFLVKLSHPFVLGCLIFMIFFTLGLCLYFSYMFYWMEFISNY